MRKKLFNPKKNTWVDHEIAIAVYTHKSVCLCGFPALDVNVPLGKRYRVLVTTITNKGMSWKCGGCGTTLLVPALLAEDEMGLYKALPLGIFNPQSEWHL